MKISLIIPCYNEELNIQKGVLDKIGNLTQHNEQFQEVLIVDDGSTDASKNIIKTQYLKSFPKFKLIENNHKGKAYALITGIQKASCEYVIFSDIDLATPLEESNKLISEAKKGALIVIGSRSSQREGAPILRKFMAVASIIIRNLIIGLKGIRDTQCGFKLFNTESARTIINKLRVFHNNKNIVGSSVTAGFDMEFLFLASKLNYSIKEVPVIWKHVETKHVNFVRDSYEAFKDILLIKYFDLKHMYD